jgi:hypothetical protein
VPDYFTLAEFRALPDMDDSAQYADARVEAASDYIVGVIERTVKTSFVARTVTDERHDGGRDAIVLREPSALSVTGATENGVTVTRTLRVAHGILRQFASATSYTPVRWSDGVGNIGVTYSAGYSTVPPDDIKEAALRGTRAYLLETSSRAGVTDRRSTITNDQGTTTYVMAGPDHPTGYPQVDEVILGWRSRLTYGWV